VLVTLERPHGQLLGSLERGLQMSVNHQWIVYCIRVNKHFFPPCLDCFAFSLASSALISPGCQYWGSPTSPSPDNMLLSPLSLAFTFILYSAILFSWAVPLDDDSGILYRFSPVSENEIEELISWAKVRASGYRSRPGKNRPCSSLFVLAA
jgi:hypothetical protein